MPLTTYPQLQVAGELEPTFDEYLYMVLEWPVFELPVFPKNKNSNNAIPVLRRHRSRFVLDFISDRAMTTHLPLNENVFWSFAESLGLHIRSNIGTIFKKFFDIVCVDQGLRSIGNNDDRMSTFSFHLQIWD
jgi:hypothetical protein